MNRTDRITLRFLKWCTYIAVFVAVAFVSFGPFPNDPGLITPGMMANVANVKDAQWAGGAKGTGLVDDTVAVQAAIAGLPASGGTVYFPPGFYAINGSLNVSNTVSVRLVGAGGTSAGAATASMIEFTGTPARCIDARSSVGFCLLDLGVTYTNAGMVGPLIDFSHSTAADAQFMSLERSYLGGSASNASSILNLDKADSGSFRDLVISHGLAGVAGAASSGSYSNGHTFSGCQFFACGNSAVSSTGRGWSFTGCVFEPVVGGAPATVNLGTGIGKGISFAGCWFGDETLVGAQINIGNAQGVSITGCYFGCPNALAVNSISIDNGAIGIWIAGNAFDGGSLVTCVFFTTTPTNALSVYFLGNSLNLNGGSVSNASFKTGMLDANGQTITAYGILDAAASGTGFTGNGLRVSEAANGKQGLTAAMVAGTVTVANTNITATSRIIVTRQDGGTNPGAWYVSARVAGTSVTFTSTNAADTGQGAYEIFEVG